MTSNVNKATHEGFYEHFHMRRYAYIFQIKLSNTSSTVKYLHSIFDILILWQDFENIFEGIFP